jgi:hypothetical protein
MDLKAVGWKGVDWLHLAQDSDKWRAVVNTTVNLRITRDVGCTLTS